MRQFFKTCRVHYCFSQEDDLLGLNPKKCKCRKLVSKDMAQKLVEDAIADWVLDHSGDVSVPTWDIVLKGRAGKTPRAHTIESAHMERYAERMYNPDFDNTESQELLNLYHDIEMEVRLKLFGDIGNQLLQIKRESDTYGNLEGESGKVLVDKIVTETDSIKNSVAKDDMLAGRHGLVR